MAAAGGITQGLGAGVLMSASYLRSRSSLTDLLMAKPFAERSEMRGKAHIVRKVARDIGRMSVGEVMGLAARVEAADTDRLVHVVTWEDSVGMAGCMVVLVALMYVEKCVFCPTRDMGLGWLVLADTSGMEHLEHLGRRRPPGLVHCRYSSFRRQLDDQVALAEVMGTSY